MKPAHVVSKINRLDMWQKNNIQKKHFFIHKQNHEKKIYVKTDKRCMRKKRVAQTAVCIWWWKGLGWNWVWWICGVVEWIAVEFERNFMKKSWSFLKFKFGGRGKLKKSVGSWNYLEDLNKNLDSFKKNLKVYEEFEKKLIGFSQTNSKISWKSFKVEEKMIFLKKKKN